MSEPFDFGSQPLAEDFDSLVHISPPVGSAVADRTAKLEWRDCAVAHALSLAADHPDRRIALAFDNEEDCVAPVTGGMFKSNALSMMTKVWRGQIVWSLAESLDEIDASHFKTPEFQRVLKHLGTAKPELVVQFDRAVAGKGFNTLHGALVEMHCELLDQMASYFNRFVRKQESPSHCLRQMFCRPGVLDTANRVFIQNSVQ